MEAKLERPTHGHQDGVTHSVVGGEDEGEKQKKSVLKKVKDKAKKVKDTIKNHGHGHHHHQQQNDQLHGTPRYESSVARESNLEKPKDDSQHHQNKGYTRAAISDAKTESPPAKPLSESASEYEKGSAGVNVMSKGSENGNSNSNSVKEYLSEKLKPGEEDKALSEVITDALHNKGSDDDAYGEREDPMPRGKVTVSKEVAERLGLDKESKREGDDAVAAGQHSQGNTVSERLQNAFTSWFAKGTGIQTARDSIANAFVNTASTGDAPKLDSPNEPRHQ